MSFKGEIMARCPGECEPVEVEVWSFVRGDQDEPLRESLLAGDLNLLVCENCGRVFSPEATVVYFDPREEFLAFIFPEMYRSEEERWRAKMHDDFEELRGIDGTEGAFSCEPLLFFGMAEVSKQMNLDEGMEDEVRVAEHLCLNLDLALLPIDRAYARARALPRVLPYSSRRGKKAPVREDALDGLMCLLKANDRLEGFRRWLAHLGGRKDLPPRGKARES